MYSIVQKVPKITDCPHISLNSVRIKFGLTSYKELVMTLDYITLLQLTILGLNGGWICLAYNLSQSMSLKNELFLIFSWSSIQPSLSVGSLLSNYSIADNKIVNGDYTEMTYILCLQSSVLQEGTTLGRPPAHYKYSRTTLPLHHHRKVTEDDV